MPKILTDLWNDEGGFVLTAELVLIATILVLGLLVGLTALQKSLVAELTDVSGAFNNLDQSYCYRGFSGRSSCVCAPVSIKAMTVGSSYTDRLRRVVADTEVVPAPIVPAPIVPVPEAQPRVIEPVPQPEVKPVPKAEPCPPVIQGPFYLVPAPCPKVEPAPGNEVAPPSLRVEPPKATIIVPQTPSVIEVPAASGCANCNIPPKVAPCTDCDPRPLAPGQPVRPHEAPGLQPVKPRLVPEKLEPMKVEPMQVVPPKSKVL